MSDKQKKNELEGKFSPDWNRIEVHYTLEFCWYLRSPMSNKFNQRTMTNGARRLDKGKCVKGKSWMISSSLWVNGNQLNLCFLCFILFFFSYQSTWEHRTWKTHENRKVDQNLTQNGRTREEKCESLRKSAVYVWIQAKIPNFGWSLIFLTTSRYPPHSSHNFEEDASTALNFCWFFFFIFFHLSCLFFKLENCLRSWWDRCGGEGNKENCLKKK